MRLHRNLPALLVGLVLCPALSAATVDLYLRAEETTATMPDGAVIPMWGFVQTDSGFTPLPGQTPSAPGPVLRAAAGDTLRLHVRNLLGVPISLQVPGQITPTSPVFFTDGQGRERVRSFTHETAAGATGVYTWANVRGGTFLYQSATHPAVQVQMGLYGALVIDSGTPGLAYAQPGSAYDREFVLVYSEIDPLLHEQVDQGTYGTTGMTSTIHYAPKYFLINGRPFPDTPALTGANAGERVLLRFVNAGLRSFAPLLLGRHMRMIAEDGFEQRFALEQYTFLLPAGQTKDTIVQAEKPGRFALLDRRLNLTNGPTSPGGLLTFLQVDHPGHLYVDPAACPGPGSGTAWDPYCSLATALAAAAEGDTLVLAEGVHSVTAELSVGVAGLRITGAGAGVTWIDGSGKNGIVGANGDDVLLHVAAGPFTLENLTLDLGDGDTDFDIGVFTPDASDVDFVTIRNCTLLHAAFGGAGEQLIHLGGGLLADVTQNTFDLADGNAAIRIGTGDTGLLAVTGNSAAPVALAEGGANDLDGGGTFLDGLGPLWNSDIVNNFVLDAGVAVRLGGGSLSTTGIFVSGNAFVSAAGTGGFGALAIRSTVNGAAASYITVTDNLFTGTGSAGAITLADLVPAPADVLGGTIIVAFNQFAGDNGGGAITVGAGVAGNVDAEWNWWGDASGPFDPSGTSEAGNPPCFAPAVMRNADGLGDAVSDQVDYCPWRTTP